MVFIIKKKKKLKQLFRSNVECDFRKCVICQSEKDNLNYLNMCTNL